MVDDRHSLLLATLTALLIHVCISPTRRQLSTWLAEVRGLELQPQCRTPSARFAFVSVTRLTPVYML